MGHQGECLEGIDLFFIQDKYDNKTMAPLPGLGVTRYSLYATNVPLE